MIQHRIDDEYRQREIKRVDPKKRKVEEKPSKAGQASKKQKGAAPHSGKCFAFHSRSRGEAAATGFAASEESGRR